jgi:hypothetical protein
MQQFLIIISILEVNTLDKVEKNAVIAQIQMKNQINKHKNKIIS